MRGRVLFGLVLVALIAGCFWQPEDSSAGLAVEAILPRAFLSAAGGSSAAGTGSVAGTTRRRTSIVAQQSFSGQGMLYAYVIEESYLRMSEDELDRLFDALEAAQTLSEEELAAQYPAARIRTLPINFALGSSGSLGMDRLKGDATYVVAVFAEACEGDLVQEPGEVHLWCHGVFHEALDFRRLRLPAGETTRVQLRLDKNFDAFANFLEREYGFVISRPDDWEEDTVPETDEGEPEPTQPEPEPEPTPDPEPEPEPEPGLNIGDYRVFSVSTPFTATLSDGTNTYNVVLSHFAWEYRGPVEGSDPQRYRYHLWFYNGEFWEYSQANDYLCESPTDCNNAAGRLQLTSPPDDAAYLHNVIFGSSPEGPTSEIEYSADRFEFARLYLPGLGDEQLDNGTATRNTELTTTAPGTVIWAHTYAEYTFLDPGPFGPTLDPLEPVE